MYPARLITRQENKLITRNRLLAAATELLRSKEHSAIAIADITTGAGVTQPAFYRHFESKDACLAEAIRIEVEHVREVLRQLRAELLTAATDSDPLRAMVTTSFKLFAKEGECIRLILRELRQPGEASRLLPRDVRATLIGDAAADLQRMATQLGVKLDMDYVALVIDGLAGLGEPLLIGHMDGRITDVNRIVDILVSYLRATLPDLMGKFSR